MTELFINLVVIGVLVSIFFILKHKLSKGSTLSDPVDTSDLDNISTDEAVITTEFTEEQPLVEVSTKDEKEVN
jgi:hypothetical protein